MHEFVQQNLGCQESPPLGAEIACAQGVALCRIGMDVNFLSAEQDRGAMVQVGVLRADLVLFAGFAAMEVEIFRLALSLRASDEDYHFC